MIKPLPALRDKLLQDRAAAFLDRPCFIGDTTTTYAQDCIDLINLATCPVTIAAVTAAIRDSLPQDDGITKRLLWDRLTPAQRQKLANPKNFVQ